MVRLKIHPPRRRTSERVTRKTKSASAASTPTTATSGSSAGDTIEVAQKSDAPAETGNEAAVATDATSPEPVRVGLPAKVTEASNGTAAQATAREGDADQDEDMVDVDDDTVTEYDFSNETEIEDDESKEPAISVDNEVITISSDDENEVKEEKFPLDPRPWLSIRSTTAKNDKEREKELEIEREHRRIRELMYCTRRDQPVGGGDWETTELFQEQLDIEIEEYTKDFPLQVWVVGFDKASRGFERLLQRKRMRSIGVAVFQQQPYPGMMGPPMQPPHNGFQGHHSGHAPRGHHQMPMMRHHPPQQMLPPHMMHHGGMPYGLNPPPMAPQFVVPSHHPMQQGRMSQHHAPVYQQLPSQQTARLSTMPASGIPSRPRVSGQANAANGTSANSTPANGTTVNRDEHAMQADLPESGPRKRQKRESSTTAVVTENLPIVVPPYPVREKPATEVKQTTKSGRTSKRRVAGPVVFPWNRNIDFEKAKAEATWDVSIYQLGTLNAMESVRAQNAKYVQKIDIDDQEKQRQSKLARKQGGAEASQPKRQVKQPKTQDEKAKDGEDGSNATAVETHGFGNFCFATEQDARRGVALTHRMSSSYLQTTPEEVMDLVETGDLDINTVGAVYICWNPGKKGLTQDLEQIKFSIKDSLLTRQQLKEKDILTAAAAECIIDFCPDLLWRDTLLRITSETELRSKNVRDRMCKNGNYIDKATITKRIGSALGQKQQSTTAAAKKRNDGNAADDGDEEIDFYKQNCEDYQNYQLFFGKGPSMRKNRIGPSEKFKRKGTEEASSSAAGSRPGSSGSDGSVMEVKEGFHLSGGPEGMEKKSVALRDGKGKGKERDIVQIDGASDEREEEEEGGAEVVVGEVRKELDEVSEQSDGQLDEISD